MDYITKTDAFKAILDALAEERSVYDAIDALPNADVRPVVYCKDCKCYQQSNFVDKHMECVRYGCPVHPVDFCSFGEKREE